MGTLAKRLGQLAQRSLQSESSNIIKNVQANKHGLSKMLDATLKNSHDMRVFGLGTAASMANMERYCRFTKSMHAVYAAMETGLDSSKSAAVATVWSPFAQHLRRTAALRADLDEACSLIGIEEPAMSAATRSYVSGIEDAAQSDNDSGGARLIGHLYCRYFADLFGGQGLASPYRWALDLPRSPRHYDFGEFGRQRRQSIQAIYSAINEAGELLDDDDARKAVVEEARLAFSHNVHTYSEEGGLYSDGAKGLANIVTGFVRSRMQAK